MSLMATSLHWNTHPGRCCIFSIISTDTDVLLEAVRHLHLEYPHPTPPTCPAFCHNARALRKQSTHETAGWRKTTHLIPRHVSDFRCAQVYLSLLADTRSCAMSTFQVSQNLSCTADLLSEASVRSSLAERKTSRPPSCIQAFPSAIGHACLSVLRHHLLGTALPKILTLKIARRNGL